MLRDLAIEHHLLELGEGQVAEGVMPVHEFGLVVDCDQVDVLVFLKLGLTSKVSSPTLVVSFSSLSPFPDNKLLTCTVRLLLVAPSESVMGFLGMSTWMFSLAVNSLSRWSWLGIWRMCSR
jgi:hypothetical protein